MLFKIMVSTQSDGVLTSSNLKGDILNDGNKTVSSRI